MIRHGQYTSEAETRERALRGLLATGVDLVDRLDRNWNTSRQINREHLIQWAHRVKEVLDE